MQPQIINRVLVFCKPYLFLSDYAWRVFYLKQNMYLSLVLQELLTIPEHPRFVLFDLQFYVFVL